MADTQVMKDLKMILREEAVPFFEDDELEFHLRDNGNNLHLTAYRCLIIKSENSTMNLAGLSLSDTSSYFRRLAMKYRPRNTGILRGGL